MSPGLASPAGHAAGRAPRAHSTSQSPVPSRGPSPAPAPGAGTRPARCAGVARARLGPVSPRRAPWRCMRDPNAPNPQDMQRRPSHCAKRRPGADVQARAAPPARLRRSETVFQIKAYLKNNNKTWRLGKAPARPDTDSRGGRGGQRKREKPPGGVGLRPSRPELSPSDRMPPGALAAAHTSLSRPRS